MARHRGRRPAGVLLALALTCVGVSGVALAGPARADVTAGVTICHAAGSSGRWVVITVGPSALTSRGHRAHQGERDVIPPFEHAAEGGATTRVEGQNWTDNWPVDGSGRATGAVEASDCGAAPARKAPKQKGRSEDGQPAPSVDKGSAAAPRNKGGVPSASPSGAADTRAPSVGNGDARPALVSGGLALLLAGGATAVGAARRRGDHT